MKNTVLLMFLCVVALTSAQKHKDVILTIDNESVYTDEFLRIYKKNIDLVQDESQKDIDEYLQLYIDYKLKVLQAEELGLDDKESFKREFSGYKKQLAKNYLTDTHATDALIEEAYNRFKEEVYVKHILVRLDETARDSDTVAVYKQITDIRNEALSNGFDNTMKKYHDGRTIYGEDLGYFSVFKMVYPFENMAYNTKVGDVSQVFRTRFGYHILKVEDRRDNRGQVEVAHIMIASADADSADEKQHAKQQIEDLYTKLNEGEDFASLAKGYSADQVSAQNGGVLNRFSAGELSSPEFEGVAFSLQNEGDLSEPFKSKYGWHIVKLIHKYPIGSYEEEKHGLELKLKGDSRSKFITTTFVNQLKKDYNFIENKDAVAYAKSLLTDDLKTKVWSFDKNDTKLNEVVFTINDNKEVMLKDLLVQLEFRQKRATVKSLEGYFEDVYDGFVQQQILNYREEHLVDENEEYANIVQEYRDGLLLFDLMQTTIWDRAKSDTLGLQDFFKKNQGNYNWGKRGDVVIAVCNDKETATMVKSLLEAGKSVEEIKAAVNSSDRINAVITTGLVEEHSSKLPEQYALVSGVSKIFTTKANSFTVVKTTDVLAPAPKKLDEAKGRVINDYQQFLEEKWISDLRVGHKVKIHKSTLKAIKKELGNAK